MNPIKATVYLSDHQGTPPMDVVYGSDVPIELTVGDVQQLPQKSTAAAYANAFNTQNVYVNQGTVSVTGNKIKFTPDHGFFAVGDNFLVVKVHPDGDTGDGYPFPLIVHCHPNPAWGTIPANPVDIKGYAEQAKASAEQAAAVLDEIKANYPMVATLANDVNRIREDLSTLTGNEILQFERGYYIDTHVTVADITSKKASTTGLMVSVDECTSGDVYYVTGTGGTNGRLWAFVSDDGTVISKAASSATEILRKLIAPDEAAYFVSNLTSDGGSVYKNLMIHDVIDVIAADGERSKDELFELTGNIILSMDKDCYIDTHTATADITIKHHSDNGFMCAAHECEEDDIYFVSGTGGVNARLWAFISADGTVLSRSGQNVTATKLKLVAPEDAAYIVFNFNSNGGYVVKNTYLRDEIAQVQKDIIDTINTDGYEISPVQTSNSPNGFRFGLYHTSDGQADSSVNYIRTRKPIPIAVGTKRVEVTPGTDTTVSVIAFSEIPNGTSGADNSTIYKWGERSEKVSFEPVDGVYYYISQHSPYGEMSDETLPRIHGYMQLADKILGMTEDIRELQEGHGQTTDEDWHVFGSSSEAGYYSYFDENGDPQTVRNRPDLMYTYIANQKYYHRQYINHAEGGAGFVAGGAHTGKNGLDVLDEIQTFRPRSLITVHYSGNDYNLKLYKNNIDDGTYKLGSLDSPLADGSFYGNAMAFFERLIAKAPDSTIIMIIKYFKSSGGSKEENHYSYGTKQGDCTWGDLANAMIEICNHYGIPYIDWSRGTGFINTKNAKQVMPDGKHITKELHESLAKMLIGSLMYY